MIAPYYSDDTVTLYCGNMREILPELGEFDACLTDPPYGETSLAWDRWPAGWPALVSEHTSSMWCFGSMRMFLDRRDDFSGWRLSQDVVWEKQAGSGFTADRFKRVHELVLHFYQGKWSDVAHEAVVERVPGSGRRATSNRGVNAADHRNEIGPRGAYDETTRLLRSVLRAPNMNGRKPIHPTEKPAAILAPLIEYAVPVGGTVLDVFAGSCSTGLTARQLGRRAVLIEADEEMCEKAVVERLSIPDLFSGGAA